MSSLSRQLPQGSPGHEVCKCGSRHMPSGTRSQLPPATRPHADGDGINSDQPEGDSSHLAQHVCVERCRETWREPERAEGCVPAMSLASCCRHHAPPACISVTRRGMHGRRAVRHEPMLFRRLHAGVMRLMMATSSPFVSIYSRDGKLFVYCSYRSVDLSLWQAM
jgi:hypothetical protein